MRSPRAPALPRPRNGGPLAIQHLGAPPLRVIARGHLRREHVDVAGADAPACTPVTWPFGASQAAQGLPVKPRASPPPCTAGPGCWGPGNTPGRSVSCEGRCLLTRLSESPGRLGPSCPRGNVPGNASCPPSWCFWGHLPNELACGHLVSGSASETTPASRPLGEVAGSHHGTPGPGEAPELPAQGPVSGTATRVPGRRRWATQNGEEWRFLEAGPACQSANHGEMTAIPAGLRPPIGVNSGIKETTRIPAR